MCPKSQYVEMSIPKEPELYISLIVQINMTEMFNALYVRPSHFYKDYK